MSWSQNGIDFVCQQFGDLDECVVSTGLVFDYTDVQGNSFSGVVGGTPDIVAFIVLGLVESITMKTPSRAPIPAPQTMLNNMNGSSISLADAQELTNHDDSADQWCYTGPILCTNPPGAEGEDPCGDGGTNQPLTDHKYMCIDGAWVDQGFNPICTAVNCTNPVGEDGQTIPCGDGGTNQPLTDHAYKCINGSWLDQGLNPDCGAMLCSEYTDKPSCETADCYWYKKFIWEQESCHSKPLDPMEQYLIYGGIAAAGIAVIILLARR